jgi:endonuclease/exonuclease/phosphatase family metal-dependent hydrolase
MSNRLAEDLGYQYLAAGYNVQLREGMYGNATLTNWPIVRERNIDLSVGRKKRRGCQYTRLEIPNGASGPFVLDVFNLHLGLSARERRQQLGLLVSSREFAGLGRNASCVVGGDFNDWRSQLEAPLTRALRFQCATSQNGVGRSTKRLKTYPAFSPRGPLDRIYYRGDLELVNVYRCRHQVSKLASDHLPIIVDLELTGNGSPA